jgi:hypothetical protein
MFDRDIDFHRIVSPFSSNDISALLNPHDQQKLPIPPQLPYFSFRLTVMMDPSPSSTSSDQRFVPHPDNGTMAAINRMASHVRLRLRMALLLAN